MKKQMPLVIGWLMLSLFSAPTQGRAEQPPPQINVSGAAEVKVAPDEVDLSVAVETRDEDLQSAKQKNDEHVTGALAFLKRVGVPDKQVQTDYVSIEPVYNENNSASVNARTRPMYYLVRKNIGIKLTEVASFDKVMTGLLTNGVNFVQGIDYRTSELRKYKDQARDMAIKAAKEKADAMASALGVKVGKPYSINVNDWSGYLGWSPRGWGYGNFNAAQNVSQNYGGSAGENGATLAVGQISVSANVSVTFLIQ